MAHAALREIPVDQVIWVPTGAPGYRSAPVASGAHRLAMLRLALAGEPRFSIDERELAPHASGYTVDTLRALRAERPADKLYLLIGGDQFAKFGAWREPEEIKRLAELAVFARPQAEAGPREALFVPMAPLAVSASEVRARAARGEDVSGLVPEPVANYLRRHRLYS
jgi:nicotinate-nucleotide adenylyltransferase